MSPSSTDCPASRATGFETKLSRFVSPPSSWDIIWRFIVVGLVIPLCACSFCELIGRKKACDVRVGTWLLLVELVGRTPIVELPTLPAMLPRFPDRPRRRGVP